MTLDAIELARHRSAGRWNGSYPKVVNRNLPDRSRPTLVILRCHRSGPELPFERQVSGAKPMAAMGAELQLPGGLTRARLMT